MWLASLSRRSPISGRIVGTAQWSEAWRTEGIVALRSLLEGVGEPSRERAFRMNVTLCAHRVLAVADRARLSVPFDPSLATNLAGGPVEILEETEEGAASTRPCVAPRHLVVDPARPDLWAPGAAARVRRASPGKRLCSPASVGRRD